MQIGDSIWDQLSFYGPILFGLLLIVMPLAIIILAFFHTPLFGCLGYFALLLACHFWIAPVLARTPLRQAGQVLAYTAALVVPVYFLTGHPHPWMLYPVVVVSILSVGRYWMTRLVAHQMYRFASSKDSHKGLSDELLRAHYDFDHRYALNIVVLVGFYMACLMGFFHRWSFTTCLLAFAQYALLLLLPACLFVLARAAFHIHGDSWPEGLLIGAANETDSKKLDKMVLCSLFDRQNAESIPPDEIVDYFDRAGEVRKIPYFSSLIVLAAFSAYGSAYTLLPNPVAPFSLKTLALVSVGAGLLLIHIPYIVSQKLLVMRLTARFSGEDYRSNRRNLESGGTSWLILGPAEIVGASIFAPLSFWLINRLVEGLGI